MSFLLHLQKSGERNISQINATSPLAPPVVLKILDGEVNAGKPLEYREYQITSHYSRYLTIDCLINGHHLLHRIQCKRDDGILPSKMCQGVQSSPNLNPIENVWETLTWQLYHNIKQYLAFVKLKEVIIEA